MNRERLHKVQADLIHYLALEEQFWQQKAGMSWLKNEGRNTNVFHAQVNGRRKRLQLNRIQNSIGSWVEGTNDLAEAAVQFFEEQLHEEIAPTSFHIIDHIPSMAVMEQNQNLIKQPTKKEVEQAVFGLNGESTGGLDGYTGSFFHTCWDISGNNIFDMVRDFFNGFVKGRSIVENMLLTQEIITDIRLRTKAGPNVVIELDMTKAYDKLSWLLLTKVLRKMGFCEQFISLIFGIISNNWYFVLINGQPNGFFKSTRGVNQGDPLSLALFILAAEALSRGLNDLHRNLYFCGFGLPKWSPKINHLSYVDDMIIFSSLDATSLRLVMEVLRAYETASGQLVNTAKSSVYMHHSTSMEVVTKVERITGIGRHDFPFTYLGCPILYSRRKMDYYQGLITKVLDKLHSWKGKLLSIGGRAVLISHVLQSIPIHLLSAVSPPNFVINKLHKLFTQSLNDVYKALFYKLWWNFRTKPSLWSSFMSQKYCKKLNAIIVPWRQGSQVWKKMLECRDIIEHQIVWHPKMGSALFSFDNWTGLGSLYFLVPQNFGIDESIHNVYDVVEEGTWNVNKMLETLPEKYILFIVEKIKPPTLPGVLDKPYRMLDSHGKFTVKTVWEYLRSRNDTRIAYNMIWRRNSRRYGEAVTVNRVIYQISTTIQSLVKVRKPGLQSIPPGLLQILENYTPHLKVEKVCWEFPHECWMKINTDGASRGNPGRSVIGFCIRNDTSDVTFAVGKEINEATNTEAEACTILEALRHCRDNRYIQFYLQTDSLLLKNLIDGIWKPPWIITTQIEEIRQLMQGCNIRLSHIYREGNRLADHLANYAL
nr:uncharacterized protein LOC104115277 [Nicotiana tomentosiformis]